MEGGRSGGGEETGNWGENTGQRQMRKRILVKNFNLGCFRDLSQVGLAIFYQFPCNASSFVISALGVFNSCVVFKHLLAFRRVSGVMGSATASSHTGFQLGAQFACLLSYRPPCCIALCFIALHRWCAFYKLKTRSSSKKITACFAAVVGVWS